MASLSNFFLTWSYTLHESQVAKLEEFTPFLRDSFNKAPKTFKKFAPNYAVQFWLNGYGVKDLVQMRGHGLRLSLLDWKNNRIIQTNGFAISWKPQKLIDLIWN